MAIETQQQILEHLSENIQQLKFWFAEKGEPLMGWSYNQREEKSKRFVQRLQSETDEETEKAPIIVIAAERFFQEAAYYVHLRKEVLEQQKQPDILEEKAKELHRSYSKVIRLLERVPYDLYDARSQLKANMEAARRLAKSKVAMSLGEAGCDLRGYQERAIKPYTASDGKALIVQKKHSWLGKIFHPQIDTLGVNLQLHRLRAREAEVPEGLADVTNEALINARNMLVEIMVENVDHSVRNDSHAANIKEIIDYINEKLVHDPKSPIGEERAKAWSDGLYDAVEIAIAAEKQRIRTDVINGRG